MLTIRQTTTADIEEVVRLYEAARAFMKETGNPTQWSGAYPAREDVERDIARGIGYVACQGERIVCAFAFFVGDEPTYRRIEGGAWQNERPYGVVHRIATSTHGRGIAGLRW